MTSTAPRSQRINLRATSYEVSVLRQASGLAGTTLTSFVLTTAVTRAESMLVSASDSEQDSLGGNEHA